MKRAVAAQCGLFEKIIGKFDREWFLAIMCLYVGEVDFRKMVFKGCVDISDLTKKYVIWINVDQWQDPESEEEPADFIEREQKLTLAHEVIHIFLSLHGVDNSAVNDDLIEKAAERFRQENEELVTQVFSAIRNGRLRIGQFGNQIFSEFSLEAL